MTEVTDAEARLRMRACAMRGDLSGALEWAKFVKVTDEELAAQRDSWVRGEIGMAETTDLLTRSPERLTSMAAALAAVAAERRRQIEIKGWTPDHDDQHTAGELATAAACYALEAALPDEERDFRNPPPDLWPWANEWWKPSFRVRGLVKACAMLIAEIERLERQSARASS